jgi:hypothetical protein
MQQNKNNNNISISIHILEGVLAVKTIKKTHHRCSSLGLGRRFSPGVEEPVLNVAAVQHPQLVHVLLLPGSLSPPNDSCLLQLSYFMRLRWPGRRQHLPRRSLAARES